ncbi:MAG: helix-turn-helix domain-containing protein [Oscillospiraceae bacterium]|nr:helix-turn-helix domain-containing protein [Oscillospiraceae bacterium]
MEQRIKTGNCLGQRIRKARNAKALTQDQLVAKLQLYGCDISRSTYAKIEAGIRHISVGELNALKEVLEMRYEDFFA